MSNATRGYLFTTLTCAATTALGVPLSEHLELANIIMLFLLAVVAVALYLGRGPSVWAAFLSVACFDFFFVPPKYTFSVDDPQYLLTFAIMLAVALVIGQLTAALKRQSQAAAKQELCAHAMRELASELAGALNVAGVVQVADRIVRGAIGADVALLLPDGGGQLSPAGATPNERLHIAPLMLSVAYHNTPCTDLDAKYPTGYFPLRASTRVHGVFIAISPTQSALPLSDNKEFLETVAALVAIVLERLQHGDTPRTAN